MCVDVRPGKDPVGGAGEWNPEVETTWQKTIRFIVNVILKKFVRHLGWL